MTKAHTKQTKTAKAPLNATVRTDGVMLGSPKNIPTAAQTNTAQ